MSAPTDGWIAFADGMPDMRRMIVLGRYHGGVWECQTTGIYADFTHWHYCPAPPKPELTQDEQDAEEFHRWHFTQADDGGPTGPCPAWHAALAWERAQVRKLLSERCWSFDNDTWRRLAERVGLKP